MIIPFIKYSKIWLAIGVVTVAVSLAALVVWRLEPGIDFTGGSLLELSFSANRPSSEAIKPLFTEAGFNDTVVQKSGDQKMIVRTNFLSEEQHQAILKNIRGQFGKNGAEIREERFETIGSAVSSQLRQRAIWAIIAVSLGIVLYMAYAFRKVSRPVASWKYGTVAVLAMIHDIILVLGVFAVLGHFKGVEVDIAFVVALLTVLGFSVNDTIVVFDRVRENLQLRKSDDFSTMVNNGLNETLMRSINTTLTVLIPLGALYFLGGPTIHYFALALFIGMASGAYSSIFIASPLLAMVEKWQRRVA
ncbi:MAG: protein translocase subunit SecF [Candidatus Magasanikbacteria bacterium]|nr:protein translocase subunit SecF [Candidatus Magasanikbacteria bacterium]